MLYPGYQVEYKTALDENMSIVRPLNVHLNDAVSDVHDNKTKPTSQLLEKVQNEKQTRAVGVPDEIARKKATLFFRVRFTWF